MIHAQNTKEVVMVAPQSIANGTSTQTVTGTVDCIGYDYAVIRTILDTAATTASLAAFKLSENDDAGTTWTDIAVFTGGTATSNFTLPVAAGTSVTGEVDKMYVDLTKRKRYLQVTVNPSTVRLGAVTAELWRAEVAPTTAAGRGLAVSVVG